MDGPWPILLAILAGTVPFVVSVICFMRHWIVAGPIEFQPFERDQIPVAFQEREEIFSSQLRYLGFHAIGACRWKWNRKVEAFCTVWIRNDIVAGVNVVVGTSKRRSAVMIGLGQEYMNDSSIGVINYPDWLALNPDVFDLPSVDHVAKLDEILQAVIAKRRGGRLPFIPADAMQYINRETDLWRERVVKAGLYRLNAKGDRYWPTLKCLGRVLRTQWSNRRSFRLGRCRGFRKTNQMLMEFGFPDLEALKAASNAAFPVIRATEGGVVTGASQSPPPRTSPSP